jgi:biotin-dependent carboxylase-like uncharacterized protein
MLVVDRPGALALIQDLGRGGLASLGVSPSGAADRAALRLANRLLGNPEGAAAIECLLGGLRITSSALHWVTVTGAPTTVIVNQTRAGSHSSIALRPGDTLTIAPPRRGLRNYLAVRGGLQTPMTLGSRSSDVLSGLGPPPLEPGQTLPVGRAQERLPDTDLAPPEPPRTTLEVLPGPRRSWFTDGAWQKLLTTGWHVSQDSNRVAVRLAGAELNRAITTELPSEAMVRGAVQVPSSGQPLIFGPDHPVTGGYPVIAVLTDRASDHAAQLRPGDIVWFSTLRG